MIAWMLYAMLVAALFGWAALLAERGFRMFGRAGRIPWILAMVASAAVPTVTPFLRQAATEAPSSAGPLVVFGGPGVWEMPVAAIERVGAATVSLNALLAALWAAASLALLAWLTWSWLRLRRERATWIADTVDGHRVFVSPDVGPAVVDPIQGGVVLPRWLVDAPAAERHIVLRHELEHVLASDHRLLWAALLLAVAFPWNVALWWQLRRLRHAVELDCDRRVLTGGVSPKAYADLLLHVVGAGRTRRIQPALTEQPSFLRWRIAAMIERHVRFRTVRSIGYGAVAAALVLLACETRVPEAPGEVEAVTAPPTDSTVYAESATDLTPERLSCPLPRYPAILQRALIEGEVLLHFVVGTDGAVDSSTIEVLSSSHRGFEQPARDMMARCRFRPGRVEGNPVRVLVQMPVMFRIARQTTDNETVRRPVPPTRADSSPAIQITAAAPESASGTMRGTVYDPPGQPLANARVELVGTPFSAVTGANGTYTIAHIPAGVYAVQAQFGSYQPAWTDGVRIPAGDILTANFRLADVPPRP